MMPAIRVVRNKVFIDGKPAKKKWTGGFRSCFVGDGIIVKLNDRISQSSRELRIWKNIQWRDKKMFARPIAGKAGKDGWIAQEIISFRRGRRPKSAWRLIEAVADKYGILNDCIDCTGLWCSANWGVRENGMPVIYDWGFKGVKR